MKKFIAVGLILISMFVMTGCGSTTASIFTDTNWLANVTDKGVEAVNEVNTYKVMLEPKETGANEKISMTIDATSTYSTTLTNTTFDAYMGSKNSEGNYPTKNINCYLFATELKIDGSFVLDGTTTAITDTISTKCYFLGINNNLQPLYSERTVKSHSPVVKDDSYEISYYDYKIETRYILSNDTYGDSAEVTFTKNANNKGEFAISEGTKVYTKIHDKSGNYIDNEMLFLAPRATALTETTALSFNTIDAICDINRSIKVGASSLSNKILDLTENGNRYTFDGRVKTQAVITPLSITIDSDFPGTPIEVIYANPSSIESQDLRGNLLRIKSKALYNMGTIVYTANKTTIK